VENGYFYPDNYLYVSLNPATATVDTYYYDWDEDVTFAAAKGILTEAQALDAYTRALEVTLGYVAWPESVDDDGYAIYRDWGYSYVESLRLGYYYSGLETITGVDALTGDTQHSTYTSAGAYVYDDTADLAQAQQVEALAQAGIGFAGGQLRPEETLTQREAVVLLLQATGYTTPETWEDSRIETVAQNQGFVTADTWEPEAEVTEMEFLRMVLGASRYGDAAKLTGVWASVENVAQADQGYAALGLALGMVTADDMPGDAVCTHLTALEMLYSFMSR
jgi:hypothetical protein